jgi:hypothetical protein
MQDSYLLLESIILQTYDKKKSLSSALTLN